MSQQPVGPPPPSSREGQEALAFDCLLSLEPTSADASVAVSHHDPHHHQAPPIATTETGKHTYHDIHAHETAPSPPSTHGTAAAVAASERAAPTASITPAEGRNATHADSGIGYSIEHSHHSSTPEPAHTKTAAVAPATGADTAAPPPTLSRKAAVLDSGLVAHATVFAAEDTERKERPMEPVGQAQGSAEETIRTKDDPLGPRHQQQYAVSASLGRPRSETLSPSQFSLSHTLPLEHSEDTTRERSKSRPRRANRAPRRGQGRDRKNASTTAVVARDLTQFDGKGEDDTYNPASLGGGGGGGAEGATNEDAATLDRLFAESKWRNMFFLWLLGLINNFHYNLVISAASELASQYGMKRFVALISFCNVFLGLVARILNTFAASRVSFNLRMTLMSCFTVIGLALVSNSGAIGGHVDAACFIVVLLGVTCVGTAYSYGETVALTFVQRYPATMVGAWSAGTGISGVVASVIFVILSATGMDMVKIFLFSMPLTLVYWLSFTVGLVAPQKVVYVIFCGNENAADDALGAGRRRARRGKMKVRKAKRIVLFRGRETEILAATRAKYGRDPNAFVTEATTEMVMNLFGISWRSVPAPKVAASCAYETKRTTTVEAMEDVGRSSQHGAAAAAHGRRIDTAAFSMTVGGFSLHSMQPHVRSDDDNDDGNHAEDTHATRSSLLCDPGLPLNVEDALFVHDVCQEVKAAVKANKRQGTKTHEAPTEAYRDLDAAGSASALDTPRTCARACGALPTPPPLRRWWHFHGDNITAVHKAMWWLFFNLAAVYVAEYAAQFMAPFSFYCTADWKPSSSGANGAPPAKVNSPLDSSLFWLVYSYPLSQVCYQLGVFISRSSLMVCGLKIAAVGVISILQVLNAIGWLVQAKTLFVSSKHHADVQVGLSFLLFAWMIFVGLLGGASYVNVFYLILSRAKREQADEHAIALEVIRQKLKDRRRGRHPHTGEEREEGVRTAASSSLLGGGRGMERTDAVASHAHHVPHSTVVGIAATHAPAREEREVDGHPLQQQQQQQHATEESTTKPNKKGSEDIDTVEGELASDSSSSSSADGTKAPTKASNASARVEDALQGSRAGGCVVAFVEHASAQESGDAAHRSNKHSTNNDTLSLHPNEHHHHHHHHHRHEGKNNNNNSNSNHMFALSLLSTAHDDDSEGDHSDSTSTSSLDLPNLAADGLEAPSLTKLTTEEARLLALYEAATAEGWQRRRELAMSTGSFYAMVGICCGTIIDVVFTNTFMKNNNSNTC